MTFARDDDPAEQAAREATAWFVRLKNPDATEDDRARFGAWLAADPAHADAMREITVLWEDLDRPAAALAAESRGAFRRSALRRRRGWRLAVGAAALAATFAGVALWRDAGLIDRAFADHATRPGERLDISLADGTGVYLDGDSAIGETFGEDRREVTILRGRVWFDVTRDPDRPFLVHAKGLDLRVVGTAFGVDGKTGDVVVDHGVVAVSARQGDPVRLTAGQRIGLADGGGLGPVSPVDVQTALAWRRGLIVLDAAPLGRVIDELERMAPGHVIIPDAKLRALTLSGVFHADDPAEVIAAMRTALGLRTLSLPGVATLVYR